MPNQAARDIRYSGFGDRARVSAAWAWLDGQSAASGTEVVRSAEAAGRVLADTVLAGGELPDRPRSAGNGYAVRAAECDGASAYNPLVLTLSHPGIENLVFGSASPVATGWMLPTGADAVLPFEAAQSGDGRLLEILAPVAPGTGIERSWHGPRAGATVLKRRHRLRPQDVCCLVAMRCDTVSVLPRPHVAMLVPGAKSGPDALTPLLRALLARDEAVVEQIPVDSADELALATALSSPGIGHCNLMLLAGRGGAGLDDTAALAVSAAGGTLALHGIALRPGGTTGLGTLHRGRGLAMADGIPLVLLPGEPSACLAAYDMLVARLVRRLAGLGTDLPYPVAEYELVRKIVSGIGLVEVVPVRLAGDRASPIGADAGLAGVVQADGFVVVAESSEGHAAGTRVRVHLYQTKQMEAA